MYVSFFWDSRLSEKEKEDIKKFVNSLTTKQQILLDKYITDQRADADWSAHEEE